MNFKYYITLEIIAPAINYDNQCILQIIKNGIHRLRESLLFFCFSFSFTMCFNEINLYLRPHQNFDCSEECQSPDADVETADEEKHHDSINTSSDQSSFVHLVRIFRP